MKNRIINFFGGVSKDRAEAMEYKIKMLEEVVDNERLKNKRIRTSFFYLCDNLTCIGDEKLDIEVYEGNTKALGNLFKGLRWIVARDCSFVNENYNDVRTLINKHVASYEAIMVLNENILESKEHRVCEELLEKVVLKVVNSEIMQIEQRSIPEDKKAIDSNINDNKILGAFEVEILNCISKNAREQIWSSASNSFNITTICDKKSNIIIFTQKERYINNNQVEDAMRYFNDSMQTMRKKGYSFEHKFIEKGYSFEITNIRKKG